MSELITFSNNAAVTSLESLSIPFKFIGLPETVNIIIVWALSAFSHTVGL